MDLCVRIDRTLALEEVVQRLGRPAPPHHRRPRALCSALRSRRGAWGARRHALDGPGHFPVQQQPKGVQQLQQLLHIGGGPAKGGVGVGGGVGLEAAEEDGLRDTLQEMREAPFPPVGVVVDESGATNSSEPLLPFPHHLPAGHLQEQPLPLAVLGVGLGQPRLQEADAVVVQHGVDALQRLTQVALGARTLFVCSMSVQLETATALVHAVDMCSFLSLFTHSRDAEGRAQALAQLLPCRLVPLHQLRPV